jgi:hypothetical protein
MKDERPSLSLGIGDIAGVFNETFEAFVRYGRAAHCEGTKSDFTNRTFSVEGISVFVDASHHEAAARQIPQMRGRAFRRRAR